MECESMHSAIEQAKKQTCKEKLLLDLCKSHVIPKMYWPYYQKLPTNHNVRDKLLWLDIVDESESAIDV